MKFYVLDSDGTYRKATCDELVAGAQAALARRFHRGRHLGSPADVISYLAARLSGRLYESFAVLWLDSRHRILGFDEILRGTINGVSVYPREVVRDALAINAAAAIVAHNHPSGDPQPSEADIRLTRRLKWALQLVDIQLLDHVVIGHDSHCSMSARGLL